MFFMCVLVIGLAAIAVARQTCAPQEQLESIAVRIDDNYRNGRSTR